MITLIWKIVFFICETLPRYKLKQFLNLEIALMLTWLNTNVIKDLVVGFELDGDLPFWIIYKNKYYGKLTQNQS